MKKYFKSCQNLKELRNEYKRLLKIYHPDRQGGSDEIAKMINSEYEKVFSYLKNHQETAGDKRQNDFKENFDFSVDEKLRETLNKIINLENIVIEICGTWIWVTGNTYTVKAELKNAGFRFSRNKKAWYFHTGDYRKRGKKKTSLTDIRLKYGSQKIENQQLKISKISA